MAVLLCRWWLLRPGLQFSLVTHHIRTKDDGDCESNLNTLTIVVMKLACFGVARPYHTSLLIRAFRRIMRLTSSKPLLLLKDPCIRLRSRLINAPSSSWVVRGVTCHQRPAGCYPVLGFYIPVSNLTVTVTGEGVPSGSSLKVIIASIRVLFCLVLAR